jgi:orotate phosphoribosyltransferase-like protein
MKTTKEKTQTWLLHVSQVNTSIKACELLSKGITKKELSEELDISRPTLDSRLNSRSKWKKLEQKWISKLSKDI